MDAALWDQINTLLADALDQPADLRDTYLVEHAANAHVLAEARELLAAHAAAEADDALASPFTDAPVPETVGPWRPSSRLGAGGMGVVYAAERIDASFRQRAALKLVRPGFGADFRDRFLRERRLLAGLDHRGIARLLDGGLTADGLPYLAMELVDGEPITSYAREHELAIRDRLELFLQACEAIAHAHRHLVVHRDLKPAHMLVETTEQGAPRVKLLDFGIAKLLDADEEAVLTRTGGGPMTPQYAAPEQITGGTVTTATDVYSLGVVLYELLTGQRPYNLAGLSPSEAEHMVTSSTPTRPSATTDTATDTRHLRGDLDTVVMKALSKEPERRYASAEALADDIQRYLDGLPVRARPDTWRYRAAKFTHRHRVALAAGSLALAAILGGAGVALWQAREAATERDRAQTALAQAQGTADYLESAILMGDLQSSEVDPALSVVLDSAAAHVDQEADPAVAASIHRMLTSVFLSRGDTEKAAHHAERAVAGLQETRGADYASAQTHWAQALADSGDLEGALPHHEAALAALSDETDDKVRSVVVNTYAVTLAGLGQTDAAEQRYREAIEAARRADALSTETTALQNLGTLMVQLDRPHEAIPLYEEATGIMERNPTAEFSYGLPFTLANLAGALQTDGQDEEALRVYREAVAAFEGRLGDTHPETIASRISMALHLHKMVRYREAVQAAEQVLANAEAELPPDHPYMAYAQNVAGTALCDGGDPARGAQLHRTSLAARRQVFPPDHWALANAESVLGACVARLGRTEEARGLLTRSAATLASSLGDDHIRTVNARERLAAFERDPP
ncbi:MAG: hypothetical protein Rubg2KO_08460 [Rubricoccaceae bacterium]